MKRPYELENERRSMKTLSELTGVFEGLASMRIYQIKNQVLQATEFFDELWHIYTQLRVDSLFRFGRGQSDELVLDKDLIIVITAEGGLSGDIDQKLVSWMLTQYNKDTRDIIVIGHHGAMQLAQAGVGFKKYFKLPVKDRDINVAPLIKEIQRYKRTTVFYQQYVSLMVQDVKQIEIGKAIQQHAKTAGAADDIISEQNYIFEPSTFAVVDHLERSMMQIALSQLILESKLAQYASRFRAMSNSHETARKLVRAVNMEYNHSKRALKDERLREIVTGFKRMGTR